jgi:hypothetical protein
MTVTGKTKKTSDGLSEEAGQPGQQVADEGSADGAETFANIEPDAQSFANINPANE